MAARHPLSDVKLMSLGSYFSSLVPRGAFSFERVIVSVADRFGLSAALPLAMFLPPAWRQDDDVGGLLRRCGLGGPAGGRAGGWRSSERLLMGSRRQRTQYGWLFTATVFKHLNSLDQSQTFSHQQTHTPINTHHPAASRAWRLAGSQPAPSPPSTWWRLGRRCINTQRGKGSSRKQSSSGF